METSAATILLTEAPEPKVRDRQTDEIAKDAVSGEALMTIGVVYIEEGESSLIKVTVPESGAPTRPALIPPAPPRLPSAPTPMCDGLPPSRTEATATTSGSPRDESRQGQGLRTPMRHPGERDGSTARAEPRTGAT